MNNRYTINVTIHELAVICRALRYMRTTNIIESDYQVLNKLLDDIDPTWSLI